MYNKMPLWGKQVFPTLTMVRDESPVVEDD